MPVRDRAGDADFENCRLRSQGQADVQGNRNGVGAASATGNAQARFPGSKKQSELQAHAHPAEGLQGHGHAAVLAGHKSQELAGSQSGTGGYNQLVFDDAAGAGRIELASTSAQTRLQLGHLIHQNGYYAERKRAIKVPLRYAHTKRDFANIIQHMNASGTKGDLTKNKAQVMAFLDQSLFGGGANDDDEVRNYYDRLRLALKDSPTVGYLVAENDSIQYAVQRDGRKLHPLFASLQGIELQQMA